MYGGAPEPRLQHRARRLAVQSAEPRRREHGRNATRSSSTNRLRTRSTSRSARPSGCRPSARSSSSGSPASSSSGRSGQSAAPRWPGSTFRPHRASSGSPASSTRSQWRPSRACRPRSSWPRSEASFPADTQVRTGQAQAHEDSKDTNAFISFLQKFLLGFAGVALFVGSFVIANSLSITIAQRTRELATLRTLGASRRQVLRSIIIEALVDRDPRRGRRALRRARARERVCSQLFDAVGFTLPNNGLTFETRTVVVSLAVGIIVTLLASLRPAHARDACAADRRRPRRRDTARVPVRPVPLRCIRPADGTRLRGAPVGPVRTRPRDGRMLLFMLGGALLVFFGIALLSVQARDLRSPECLGGRRRRSAAAAGVLARENSQRNPQRTASTASALMIGLALVTLVSMLAAGIISSFKGSVETDLEERRLRDHCTEQLLADPDRGGGCGREDTRRRRGRRTFGPERRSRSGRRSTRPPSTRRRARCSTSTGRRDRERSWPMLGEDGAFVDKGYAKSHDLGARFARPVDVRGRSRENCSTSRASSPRRPEAHRSVL